MINNTPYAMILYNLLSFQYGEQERSSTGPAFLERDKRDSKLGPVD